MTGEHVNHASAQANLAYQARMYRSEPKEADKILLGLIDGLSGDLLDIGCSNGNLLKHIRDRHSFKLHGADLSEIRIAACRDDPELAGIEFSVMDILNLPEASFDVIVANAVLYAIEDFRGAMASIYRTLRPGGTFIAFDFFHAFNQDVKVIEVTDEIPEGHTLRMRSQPKTRLILESLGFDSKFLPFEIPVALPVESGEIIKTHTVDMQDGARLQFRGAIYQPWCHLVAHKAL